ncbi:hypothetical protein Avbf_09310 [Armadillidium vulgare]|nr:hypothetical protein Avbf_09310 [Armadillidium vulgare]
MTLEALNSNLYISVNFYPCEILDENLLLCTFQSHNDELVEENLLKYLILCHIYSKSIEAGGPGSPFYFLAKNMNSKFLFEKLLKTRK